MSDLHFFKIVMLKGAFREFVHNHYFLAQEDGSTSMRDELRFSSPLGWIGAIADRLVLRSYLQRFLVRRNAAIRTAAEGPEAGWRKYIREGMKND